MVSRSTLPGHAQAQEVHFQKADGFQVFHGKLGCYLPFRRSGQGTYSVNGWAEMTTSGGVDRSVARETLHRLGDLAGWRLSGLPPPGAAGRGEFHRLLQGDRAGRDWYNDPVPPRRKGSPRPPDVADRRQGGHGPRGDNLGHVVGAVFLLYVFNDLPRRS